MEKYYLMLALISMIVAGLLLGVCIAQTTETQTVTAKTTILKVETVDFGILEPKVKGKYYGEPPKVVVTIPAGLNVKITAEDKDGTPRETEAISDLVYDPDTHPGDPDEIVVVKGGSCQSITFSPTTDTDLYIYVNTFDKPGQSDTVDVNFEY